MINEQIQKALSEAIRNAADELLENAKNMRPILTTDMDVYPSATVIDSTAIVIDSDILALPAPSEKEVAK